MNFIDAALAKQGNLNDDDFLQAMADIYKEPDVLRICWIHILNTSKMKSISLIMIPFRRWKG